MKRNNTSQNKSKSRSLTRTASPGLVQYVSEKYQKKIPLAAITAAQKVYGKMKTLGKDDKLVKRYADEKGNIDTAGLLGYLGNPEVHEKGKPLTEDALHRVYDNYSNDGKLTFEYIMKMGENSGVKITPELAKAIVRKYGKRKDHLSYEDCLRITERRARKNTSKSP